MEIRPDEVQVQLMDFCKKHFVHYHDLQLELSDHLWSAIETEQAQNPKLSWDQALQTVYGRFGIFGFAHIVRAKESAMEKAAAKAKRKLFWKYFTLPKITLTACLWLSLFTLGYWAAPEQRSLHILLLSLVVLAWAWWIQYQQEKKFKGQKLPLLLTASRYTGIPAVGMVLQLVVQSRFFAAWTNLAQPFHLGPYALYCSLLVLCFLAVKAQDQFSENLYQKARQSYPMAFA